MRKPSADICRKSSRKGFLGLLIVVQMNGTGGSNGDARAETDLLFRSINVDFTKARIVAHVNVNGWHDREKQTQITTERDLQTGKRKNVTSGGRVNKRADFEIEGRVKERLCLSLHRNLARWLFKK